MQTNPENKLDYVSSYYISNSHEAVLDKDTFYAVQEMIE